MFVLNADSWALAQPFWTGIFRMESNVQQDDYSQQYCVAYLKVAMRVDLISSHYTHAHTEW